MFNKLKNISRVDFKKAKTDDGFTLLEIVIAVGLLSLLSSVGVIAVRNFDNRTKEVAVQQAARQVYNAARAKVEDGNPNSTAQDAANEYMDSQSLTNNGNKPITVRVHQDYPNQPNKIRVEAWYDGGQAYAVFQAGNMTADGAETDENGVIVPVIQDTISKMTYQCDDTTSGHLPVYNISDSTTVSMTGSDSSSKLVNYTTPDLTKVQSNYGGIDFTDNPIVTTGFNNISESLTMNAGVTYTVTVYGKFTNLSSIGEYVLSSSGGAATGPNLSFEDCLISVDKLGKHTGLLTMNYIGGDKLTGMPEEIPSTIQSLQAVFARAAIFNDSNVSNWDISHLSGSALNYAFANTNTFNQTLNWNIENLSSLSAVFSYAKAYNNGGKPLLWNTSNITSLGYTFRGAASFNQNLDTRYDETTGTTYWDVSKVRHMGALFQNAHRFNNGQAAGVAAPLIWDTSDVTTMESMFHNATDFNADIRRSTPTTSLGQHAWNTGKVTNMKNMFTNATSFDSYINNWITTSVTNMSGMFNGATSFSGNLRTNSTMWNVSSVTNMDNMFNGAVSFNRDLTNWDVNKVSSYKNFSNGSSLSVTDLPQKFR